MNDITSWAAVVSYAFGAMAETPTPLAKALAAIADVRGMSLPSQSDWLERHLEAADDGDELLHYLGLAVRLWDRLQDPPWASQTQPFSTERRRAAYGQLKLKASFGGLIDRRIPIFEISALPIVVADTHESWYSQDRRVGRYYWDFYTAYLRRALGWPSESVAALDQATDAVVERISDPSRREVYRVKGLVVGYVQSGKTAHFTGVVAKAVDAGYRLIIVMAGTLNVLRFQTQRRIDKELIGRELVSSDYVMDQDWAEFNSHGERPSVAGHFDWERLTGPFEDYQSLDRALGALEFRAANKDRPLFDQQNLRHLPARLVVIKKLPDIINKLAANLGGLRTRLGDVPTLVIDDESDQASVNTVSPTKPRRGPNQEEITRSATNDAIVELLDVLPRSAYVGYTATPFANVLVNPDEPEQLFPKDFIIALPRPKGYMGVADFYDFDGSAPGGISNERAFVRNVEGGDARPENLQSALDSFVLAGAVKLFRLQADPKRFRFKHHTMLVHHGVRLALQSAKAKDIRRMFESASYLLPAGLQRLGALFSSDLAVVSRARHPELPLPSRFKELEPFVADCVGRLEDDLTVRIVNGDYNDDTPNFEKGPVWSILVGGAKLSRGYTIEGLTVSYYRRVASASDTLMQMGRWFGFRPGYQDLVRLYIGREEPLGPKGKKTIDLYEAFRAICLDEEEFRTDIRRYVDDDITPAKVPPLVPSHLTALRPTARNKMYNATISYRNFGGDYREPTVAPSAKTAANENLTSLQTLLAAIELTRIPIGTTNDTKPSRVEAYFGVASREAVLEFVKGYQWAGKADVLKAEQAYMSEADSGIRGWVVMLPQLANEGPLGYVPAAEGGPQLAVRRRSRIESGGRFKAYSEPHHRDLARFLAGLANDAGLLTPKVTSLKRDGHGVLLVYPVRDPKDNFVTIGFALQFPRGGRPQRVTYEVARRGRGGKPAPIVVKAARRVAAARQGRKRRQTKR